MKRRSETSLRDQPTLRSSSVRGFNGVRNPHFKADAARNKRVKFNEHETDPPLCNEPIASSDRPQLFDAPKTSEYAFFKKLKKNAGCRSSVIREGDEKLKTFEPSDSRTTVEPSLLRQAGFTTKFKDNFDKIRFSIPHEKAILNPGNFFSSPQANAPKAMEVVQDIENSHNNDSSPFFARRVNFTDQKLLASPLGHSSERAGAEDLDGDMFSQKRKRLRQWVAETSVPAVEELSSKGYTLVSALLSRLFPAGDQSNYNRDEEVKPMTSDTKDSVDELTGADPLPYLGDFCTKPREVIPLNFDLEFLDSPTTSQYLSDKFLLEDSYDRRSVWSKRRDHIDADHAWYWNDNFNEMRETIPLNLDTRISNSSSSCQAHYPQEYKKSYLSYDDRSTSFLALREPYYFPDLNGSSSLSHIKERNELYALDESDLRRPNIMLLDWDNSQDKGDLSHTACNKEMNLLSTPLDLSYDSYLSPGNSYGGCESHPVLFNSDFHSEVTLCPYSHLEKLNWDSSLFQDDTKLVVKPKQYPLPLTYVPEYPEEDHNSYNTFEANDGTSLQHNNCIVSKFFSERHYPELKPLLSGQGLDTYRTCLSSSDLPSPQKESIYSYILMDEKDNFLEYSQNTQRKSLYAEDTSNILEWPPLDLHKQPPERETVRPFLLNSSSSWRPSEEHNFDDGD